MFAQPNIIEKIKHKKIYTLEGNIGAGKTTILKLISNRFQNEIEIVEEPVAEWQNLGGMNLLESFYKDSKRWGFSFEFYSMFSKIKALLKAAESEKPIILVERSIISNKIFIDISKETGKLENIEYNMLMRTYDFYMEHIYPQINGVIYLDTPIDECVRRIIKRNRCEETSIDKEYLQMLKNKHDEFNNSSTLNVFVIDGKYDYVRDAKEVCDNICDFIHPNKSPKAALSEFNN